MIFDLFVSDMTLVPQSGRNDHKLLGRGVHERFPLTMTQPSWTSS